MKPPILRRMAERDVERGFDHYLAEAGPGIAVQFVDAIDAALKQIELYPASGSPRYAERLGVAALRSCRVKKFPYVFIYIEAEAHLDVLRLLHQHADIPARLRDEADEGPTL